jgi:hypothetical protein
LPEEYTKAPPQELVSEQWLAGDMLTFQLFRIKIYYPDQASVFGFPGRSGILRKAIHARPSAVLRKGYNWHIGNVEDISKDAVYFALGRTTRSHVELFNEVTGNFALQEFATSPYTHVVIDFSTQVCAIASKVRLAPSQSGIARNLGRLIGGSTEFKCNDAKVEIAAINDPEGFIDYLRSAVQIIQFSVDFGRPNPWDTDKDFHQPMQNLLQLTQAEQGKTMIKGSDLNADRLEELTRSVAATGNNAEARIRESMGARPRRRYLRGNPVIATQEDCSSSEERLSLLESIRSIYQKVRTRIGPVD